MLKLDIRNAGIRRLNLQTRSNLEHEHFPFVKLPEDDSIRQAIKEFVADHCKKFPNLVVIGLGGSARGGIAVIQALRPHALANIKFLQNIEPDQLSHFLEQIDFKRTLFAVISKSGETVETMAIFAILQERLEKKVGRSWSKQVVAITDPKKGLLLDIAKKFRMPRFKVPSEVSGRFSVFSPVGLFPAAYAGIDIDRMTAGANEHSLKSLSAQLAHIQYRLSTVKKKPITVLFPYSSRLGGLCDWYIQLLAESIGKTPKIGITPLKAIGVLDQHTQLQLFMDGPNDKFFIFIEIEKFAERVKIPKKLFEKTPFDYLAHHTLNELFSAEKKATEQALAKAGRPNVTIKIPVLNEESLGALLQFFMLEVAILGERFNVNPFNQPGVELGKKLTKKLLQRG